MGRLPITVSTLKAKIALAYAGYHPPGPAERPVRNSLDDLIGEREQVIWNLDAERLSGLDVYDQLELCRQHNRQIIRFLAFKDASGINTGLTICISNAGRVAHQTASLDIIAQDIDRGNSMSGRQRDNLFSTRLQGRTSAAEQRASLTLDKRCKGGLDFAAGAGMEDFN